MHSSNDAELALPEARSEATQDPRPSAQEPEYDPAEPFRGQTSFCKQRPQIPSNPGSQAKYLLANNNTINLKVLSAYMKRLGYAYSTATDGQEAIDAYTREPERYAGILMAVNMPIVGGFEAARRIRVFERDNRLENVKIIALAGLAADKDSREALESGIDVFLTRPVDLKAIVEALST